MLIHSSPIHSVQTIDPAASVFINLKLQNISGNQSATNFIVSLVIIDGRAIWSNEVEVLNDILSIIQIAAHYRSCIHCWCTLWCTTVTLQVKPSRSNTNIQYLNIRLVQKHMVWPHNIYYGQLQPHQLDPAWLLYSTLMWTQLALVYISVNYT